MAAFYTKNTNRKTYNLPLNACCTFNHMRYINVCQSPKSTLTFSLISFIGYRLIPNKQKPTVGIKIHTELDIKTCTY